MAVRVRKLARELKRTPWEVLGLLHALGFSRYRSPEDMLPDTTIARLRQGISQGVVARPFRPETPMLEAPPERAPAAREEAVDPMAMLVPGVVRQADRGASRSSRAAAPPRPVRPPPRLEIVPPEPPEEEEDEADAYDMRALDVEAERLASLDRRLASERAVLESRRIGLERDQQRLAEERAALQAEREGLEALREAIDLERAAAEAERLAVEQERQRQIEAAVSTGTPLQELMEARGLRGLDEAERAVAALATGRSLRDILWCLDVRSPELVERVLAQRLLLVGENPPESLPRTFARVRVSPERADVPDAADLERELRRVSELLMLNGLRRLAIVGGRAHWQRLIRDGFDPRIELAFLPDGSALSRELREGRVDALVLWGTGVATGVEAPPQVRVIRVDPPELGALFRAMVAALADD